MRNIRNRHKRIQHINSFIFRVLVLGSRVPYMLRVLSPNFMVPDPSLNPWNGLQLLGPRFSGSRSHLWDGSGMSGLGFHLNRPGSHVPGASLKMSPESWVPQKVGSHFSDMPFSNYQKSKHYQARIIRQMS